MTKLNYTTQQRAFDTLQDYLANRADLGPEGPVWGESDPEGRAVAAARAIRAAFAELECEEDERSAPTPESAHLDVLKATNRKLRADIEKMMPQSNLEQADSQEAQQHFQNDGEGGVMTSRKHIDPMPPELLEQWEAELTLAELIKKLRDTREQIDSTEQQLAYQREVEAEALEAISAYRRHLSLPDCEIPHLTPIDEAKRQNDLQLRAIRGDRSSEGRSGRGLEEGSQDG